MASVNAYLKKLLYQYDCVVVPDLGAFLTHYQPASFTETDGLYLPPRKRVAFNEALRLDDGILANYIMLHEPVTREGAQRHISQFVGELRQQVETGGRFELDGIGCFSYNDEGRLQFEPSLRHNFFGEAYGLTAISATAVNRQAQAEPVIEAVPVTALGPVLVNEDEVTLVPPRRSLPIWRVAAAALLVGSLGLVSYFSVLNPDQPMQSSVDPSTLLRMPAAWVHQLRTAEQTTAAPAVKKTTEPARPAPAAESKPTPAPVPVKAPAPLVGTPAATPALAPGPLIVTRPRFTGPHFTVFAGSFASKRNALRLRRQLRKAGFADAYIIMPAKRGQLYKVVAAGSAELAKADASAATVSQLVGAPAWIFKH